MQGFQVCKMLLALPLQIKNLFELFPLEHYASVTTMKMSWNCFLMKAMSNCSDESAEDVVRPTQEMLLQTETSSPSSERTAHSSLRVMILTFTCFLLLTGKL